MALLTMLIPLLGPFILQLLQGLIAKAATGGLNAPPPPAAADAPLDYTIAGAIAGKVRLGAALFFLAVAANAMGCAPAAVQTVFIGQHAPIRLIHPVPYRAGDIQVESKPGIWTVATEPGALPPGMYGAMLDAADTLPSN